MTRNPYYWIAGRTEGQIRLAMATLRDARRQIFLVEGKRTTAAGRAGNLVMQEADEGGLFLCAGDENGWFVLCPLEEYQ